MRHFTSDRERRLWIWALAVVVAIYSTLGLARTLADTLRDRDLIDNASFVVFLLMALAVVIHAVRRPAGPEIGLFLGVATVYSMVFLRMGTPEERTHLVEYGILAILVFEALGERVAQGRNHRAPALLAVVATALVGVIDESIQAFLPSRVFDPIDMGFNALAASMAVLATVTLRRARRRGLPGRRR